MQYQGGKSRISKKIAEVIMRYQGGKSRIAKPIVATIARERERVTATH